MIAGSALRVGDLEIRFHIDPATTNGAVAVFESIIPSKARVPVAHLHFDCDETVFGLAGVTHFTVDGFEMTLTPGTSLFVPRGQPHSFINRGSETARVLAIVTPGRLGPEYFREVAEIVNTPGLPDRERLAALMKHHGMIPALDHHTLN